jgi:SAM-dependent methyltransferase
MKALGRHQQEIQQNLRSWQNKPLLQEIYSQFYRRIVASMDPGQPGHIVEIGSGIGNLKSHLSQAICTDLFPNPWLDLTCDGYDLPFRAGSVSHLVLFDVFHHLQAPNAFLMEARRVLAETGRLILFEPYVSASSHPVYGLLHHEPVGWTRSIDFTVTMPRPRHYYAAQGNATRLFFRRESPDWLSGWNVLQAEAFSAFHYLLSGGYSRRAIYPHKWLSALRFLDDRLSRWPRLFGARCLVTLQPAPARQP